MNDLNMDVAFEETYTLTTREQYT